MKVVLPAYAPTTNRVDGILSPSPLNLTLEVKKIEKLTFVRSPRNISPRIGSFGGAVLGSSSFGT